MCEKTQVALRGQKPTTINIPPSSTSRRRECPVHARMRIKLRDASSSRPATKSRTTGCETHLRVTPPILMQSPHAPHHPARELHSHTVPYSLWRAMRNHAHTLAGRPLVVVCRESVAVEHLLPCPSPLEHSSLLHGMRQRVWTQHLLLPAMTMSSRMHMTPYHAQTGDDNRRVAAD